MNAKDLAKNLIKELVKNDLDYDWEIDNDDSMAIVEGITEIGSYEEVYVSFVFNLDKGTFYGVAQFPIDGITENKFCHILKPINQININFSPATLILVENEDGEYNVLFRSTPVELTDVSRFDMAMSNWFEKRFSNLIEISVRFLQNLNQGFSIYEEPLKEIEMIAEN